MWDFKNFPGEKPPDPRLQRAAASNAARGPPSGEGRAPRLTREGRRKEDGKGEGREEGRGGKGGERRGASLISCLRAPGMKLRHCFVVTRQAYLG